MGKKAINLKRWIFSEDCDDWFQCEHLHYKINKSWAVCVRIKNSTKFSCIHAFKDQSFLLHWTANSPEGGIFCGQDHCPKSLSPKEKEQLLKRHSTVLLQMKDWLLNER